MLLKVKNTVFLWR